MTTGDLLFLTITYILMAVWGLHNFLHLQSRIKREREIYDRLAREGRVLGGLTVNAKRATYKRAESI